MNNKRRYLVWLLIPVVIVALALGGLYRVGQGEQALVLTFGEVTDTNGPGLYWRIPLVQTVVSRSVTTIHNVEYGYRTSIGGTSRTAAQYVNRPEESVMLTNDNSIVQLEAIYQYTIRDVREYLFDVEDPEATMHLAFEAILRRNIQNRSLDDALLNKDAIEQEVLPDFQALIDFYDMGVKVHSVHIQNITVPAAVTASYEDVNNAKNEMTRRLDEAQQYEFQVLPMARSRAYELTQGAIAYEAEATARASADTAVFTAVLAEYNAEPQSARSRMLIETMEEILGGAGRIVIVDEGSNILQHLDLGEEAQNIGQ
ncbi:MAG TPA: FtsH protease activity modulator HflK [Candidatus Limnocylindria bacterium]|nr:FtsH protease activity modulator HflK [Candidatus Limnocylindria bacterium]